MDTAFGAIIGAAIFLLPGFVSALAESMRLERDPPSYGINRHILTAILISMLLHLLWVAIIEITPFFPDPDYQTIADIFSGNPGSYTFLIFKHSMIWIYVYCITLFIACFLLGWVIPDIKIPRLNITLTFLPQIRGVYRALSPGTGNTFSMVDILTSDKILYRGMYHSSTFHDSMYGEPSISISFSSRWIGEILPPGYKYHSKDKMDDKGVGNGFYDINARVNPIEIAKLIQKSIEYLNYDEQQIKMADIFSSSVKLEQYINSELSKPADICIPMSRVQNINTRHFIIKINAAI